MSVSSRTPETGQSAAGTNSCGAPGGATATRRASCWPGSAWLPRWSLRRSCSSASRCSSLAGFVLPGDRAVRCAGGAARPPGAEQAARAAAGSGVHVRPAAIAPSQAIPPGGWARGALRGGTVACVLVIAAGFSPSRRPTTRSSSSSAVTRLVHAVRGLDRGPRVAAHPGVPRRRSGARRASPSAASPCTRWATRLPRSSWRGCRCCWR